MKKWIAAAGLLMVILLIPYIMFKDYLRFDHTNAAGGLVAPEGKYHILLIGAEADGDFEDILGYPLIDAIEHAENFSETADRLPGLDLKKEPAYVLFDSKEPLFISYDQAEFIHYIQKEVLTK
ncbi:hypothetical protein AC622_07215 [Bacillus sp. FJAT-27916]|uniref:hypothetical protein n=1 Tax=Bacillaceae TaxID=186817 RepID=UPI00067142C5|nr:hypothetical protein [Bacillus sp. FJAT-27916]KMY44064.1 hypothetical protein AC622_07215 [Bacillus sp. FJAT-27916]